MRTHDSEASQKPDGSLTRRNLFCGSCGGGIGARCVGARCANAGPGGTVTTGQCYLAGTHILTPDGPRRDKPPADRRQRHHLLRPGRSRSSGSPPLRAAKRRDMGSQRLAGQGRPLRPRRPRPTPISTYRQATPSMSMGCSSRSAPSSTARPSPTMPPPTARCWSTSISSLPSTMWCSPKAPPPRPCCRRPITSCSTTRASTRRSTAPPQSPTRGPSPRRSISPARAPTWGSRLRSAVSPWIDRRQPFDVVRDRLEQRAQSPAGGCSRFACRRGARVNEGAGPHPSWPGRHPGLAGDEDGLVQREPEIAGVLDPRFEEASGPATPLSARRAAARWLVASLPMRSTHGWNSMSLGRRSACSGSKPAPRSPRSIQSCRGSGRGWDRGSSRRHCR